MVGIFNLRRYSMYIYAVSFKKHPDLVKIGFSTVPRQRLNQLVTVHGKRIKTQVYRGVLAKHAERILHKKLKAFNVIVDGDGGTEFFHRTLCKETFKSVVDLCELKLDLGFSEKCPLLKRLQAKSIEDCKAVVKTFEVGREKVRFSGKFNKQKLSKELKAFTDKLSFVLDNNGVTTEPCMVYSNNREDRARLRLIFEKGTRDVFGTIPLIYDIDVGGDANYLSVWQGGWFCGNCKEVPNESWSILRKEVFSHNIDSVANKVDQETRDILLRYKNTVNNLLSRFPDYSKPVYGVKFKQILYGTKFVSVLNVD